MTRPGGPGTDPGPTDRHVVLVVGIGSSAGGLEALQELCRSLETGDSVAYVVAQHLAPDRPSSIVDLLDRVTSLRVVEAADQVTLEPNTIYVAPPAHDVEVRGDALAVIAPEQGPSPNPSIDRLFRSIAESRGARGVAVVLSGTGVDGSQGLRAINDVDGLAIVQNPRTARFEAMPRSALSLAAADVVLAPPEIGALLTRLGDGEGGWSADLLPPDEHNGQLAPVMAELLLRSGMDLGGYRESSVRRQISRRMAVRGIESLTDYVKVLREDPHEPEALTQNLLVSVTSFFRDPEAYDALRRHLDELIASVPHDRPIRVWVAGCATGEEVYSLAMILAEQIGDRTALTSRLKIFATDLDEGALAVARRAVYPLAAREHVPPDLAERYTRTSGDSFAIDPALRDCVVFARHNVIEDPPFPQLHLVSCRNVLIYFAAPLQRRVIERLIYPLQPNGLLWLGGSESVGPGATGVEPIDSQFRIYRRSAQNVTPSTRMNPLRGWHPAAAIPSTHESRVPRDTAPDERLRVLEALGEFGPPCLVLDENNDLIEVVGDVSLYCRLGSGRLSAAALSYVREELEAEARALLLAGRASTGPLQGRTVELAGGAGYVHLQVRRLPVGDRLLTLLSFIADTEPAPDIPLVQRDPLLDREMQRLERELLASQESLRTSLEELESTNEELQASSEELQASSEELQSSYEELETSNEELEATNEELTNVNQELRLRGEELDGLNVELENIQASVNQGMVLVDRDLRVRRFTPLAVRVFALTDADIGASLLSVPTTVDMTGFAEALHTVVGGGERRSVETGGSGQPAYLIQVLPYRDSTEGRRGAIVTLTDVSEVVRLRAVSQQALHDLEEVQSALHETVWKRDLDMSLTGISPRVQDLTGYSDDEVLAAPHILDQIVVDDDKERVTSARAARALGWDIEYRITDRRGSTQWIREVAGAGLAGNSLVGTLSNVTDRRQAEEIAADRAMVLEAVFATSSFGIAALDSDDKITTVNQAFSRMLGYEPDYMLDLPLQAFLGVDDRSAFAAGLRSSDEEAKSRWTTGSRMVSKNGDTVWVSMDVRPLPRAMGEATSIVIVQDITAERASNELLSYKARYDTLTGLVNRRALRETLQREIARCARSRTRMALLWIDLDRFKEINDQYGHAVGDDVLREAGVRMQAVVRRQDVVGRLGGDEFAVLVTDVRDPAALDPYLDRLMAALTAPMSQAGAEIVVGGSIGVAYFPDDGSTSDDLMRSADHAMYAAKATPDSSYAYYREGMTEESERRRTLRTNLSRAIADEELELWFQPIVDVDTGEVRSIESLTRWRRPDGVVAAGEFIGFAEDSGLIRSLGLSTLKTLGPHLQQLTEAGWHELPVGINLSVSQLSDPTTIEQVRRDLIVPGGRTILIEVTESVFLPDNVKAQDALVSLERAGATVVIDDFGSGFSNLRLLRSVAPQQLKLDRSFLNVDPESADALALIQSAVQMAHAIGAQVVAEGIEHEWQYERARELGVEMVQGYRIARPMPIAELTSWLSEYAPTEHPRAAAGG